MSDIYYTSDGSIVTLEDHDGDGYEETTLVAEIDRLLWTGRHNDRPASYFLVTAVRGRAQLSGPEAQANRPDNSFELRWVTADRFAELGLLPSAIRGPLAELLAGHLDPVRRGGRRPSEEDQ